MPRSLAALILLIVALLPGPALAQAAGPDTAPMADPVADPVGAATTPDPLAADDPAEDAGPLRIEITEGVIEPVAIALPAFHDEGGAAELAAIIHAVIRDNLIGTGLFDPIPPAAHIEVRRGFDAPIHWQSWRAIHAEALVTGAVSQDGDQVTLKLRLHDVPAGEVLGSGIRLDGPAAEWRRLAHKAADRIYTRLTGEGAYFDSRIVFIAESGPPEARIKRLAIMDQDTAGLHLLSDGHDLVLAPRLAPDGRRIAHTTFSNGMPRVAVLDLDTGRSRIVQSTPNTMSFAPGWSPDGRWIVYSQEEAGMTNLWLMDAASGAARPLTRGPSIDTSPSFAPDGRRIVFESDRSGSPQLYVLSLDEAGPDGFAPPRRISFGSGHYGTPIWSPRGDLVAFVRRPALSGDRTAPDPAPDPAPDSMSDPLPAAGLDATAESAPEAAMGANRQAAPADLPEAAPDTARPPRPARQAAEPTAESPADPPPDLQPDPQPGPAVRFDGSRVGVMQPDGEAERLLTNSHLDEAPAWSPNGRVIVFTRRTGDGIPILHSIDVTGRNLRALGLAHAASDPDWGPLGP